MHILCGLGNPGRKYSNTRHNIGFMVIDEIIGRLNVTGQFSNKFKAEYLQVKKDGLELILLKPQTYMNLSGESLRDFAGYFKTPHENIVIICDDVNLPFGRLRLRADGSDGGHNGLKSIFSLMGTNRLARIRVGVGGNACGMDLADYVLSRFTQDEADRLKKTTAFCASAALSFVEKGLNYAMNNFNNKFGFPVETPEKKEEGDTDNSGGTKKS